MTITQELLRRSLVINVEDGVNADGSIKTKTRTYSDIKESAPVENLYNAANALVGILEGTTSFNSVDLTEAGVVVDGQVVIEPSVGSLNNYADATVAVHVAVVDAEGKVSQFTSSATCVAAKKQ